MLFLCEECKGNGCELLIVEDINEEEKPVSVACPLKVNKQAVFKSQKILMRRRINVEATKESYEEKE
jgi:hypothetical protein